MRWGQPLGLDELMIVNPGPSSGPGACFPVEDGRLYQVQGLGHDAATQEQGQLLLGEDGTVYQVQGIGLDEDLDQDGCGHFDRYFLGEDGTIYEVIG